MKEYIVGFVVGVALVFGTIASGMYIFKNASAESAPFDHSQCQYPDRTTNPPNGCDNSDPCDPAQTKGGSGDCLPIGTAEKQQAIAEHDAPFNQPAQTPKVAQCEGK